MVKAIIVDDEQITRKGLLNYVNWESLHIEVVGEATDGIEGLELAKNTKPDIAICDVRMPKMDGIELAKHIREELPRCKIIFLSGYSDKEYLKSAIKIKAVDYIEKPLDITEFHELLNKTVENCCKEKEEMMYFESSIVTSLIKSEFIDIENIKERLKHINKYSFLESTYICSVFRTLNGKLPIDAVNDITKALDGEKIKCLKGIGDNEIVMINVSDNSGEIKAICSELIKTIYDKCKIRIAAGIGNTAETINNIKKSYEEACEAIKYINDKSKNFVISFQDGREKAIIRSIEKYIGDNYRKNITINSIASSVYLTPQYLCILYKKETGKTINDFITEVRIEAAKELLKNPTLKLYEIADSIGYNDPNYFAKVFKKYVGYTPSEYRDRN